MNTVFRPAIVLFVLLTLITGFIYPGIVTIIGQWAFPKQVAGSLIEQNGKLMGSELIGQNFTDPKYFWGRPSATSPNPYNGLASGGSNLGPLNPALTDAVKLRVQTLKEADPENPLPVPVDLVTASASGLDPHISLAATQYQMHRVAKARGISLEELTYLVDANTEHRQFLVLGEPRVNVLMLNLAIDKFQDKN